MATGQGIGSVDFGTGDGSNEASVVVTGLTGISVTSKIEPFVMADDDTLAAPSGQHTAEDHRWFSVFADITLGGIVANTSAVAYAKSIHKLTGKFKFRVVWAD